MILSITNITALAKDNDISDVDVAISNNEIYIQNNFEELLMEKQSENSMSLFSTMETRQAVDASTYEYIIQNEELVNEQGESTGIYATTYASIVTDGNKYNSVYDQTIAALLYTTIYYHQRTAKGATEFCLYKVSGGYNKSDSSTAVKSQTVLYKMDGVGSEGTYMPASVTKSPTGTSWSYTTGYTGYIVDAGLVSSFGCAYTIKFQKGADTWSKTLSTGL